MRVTDDGTPAKHDDTTVTITVDDVNEAPVVAAATKSVAENSPNGTNVGSPVTFTDEDLPAQGHTFTIEGGNTGGAFAIGSTSGQVTVADTTELDFETDASYSLTVRVTDDGSPNEHGEATITIDLTNVNEPPVNTLPASFGAVPDTSTPGDPDDVTSELAGISIADPDADGSDVEVTFGVVDGTLHLASVSGGAITGNDTATVTVTASIAAINTTLADATGLVYHADAAPAGSDTLTMTTDDLGNTGSGGALTDTDTASITVNDPPVITSTAPTTATEDVLYTYDADRTDTDGPSETWSLTGSHTCGGSIVAGTGVFTFTPTGPVPPASCVVAVRVCDGGTPNQCASQSTTVAITPVNGTPVIDSTAPTTATEDLPYTYNATQSDPDGPGVTWSLDNPTHTCGGTIDPVSGVFTFTPVGPVPAASCVVAIQVCDGAPGLCASQSTTVTITPVNDPPVNSVPAGQVVPEDTDLVFSVANSNLISVSDPDAGGGIVQVTVSALHGTITPTGSGGAIITGSGTSSAVMTGTITDVNTALAGLAYRGTLDFNDSRGVETLTVAISDLGSTGTGGALTDSDTVAISVTPVNDAPVAQPQGYAAQANMKIIGLSGLLVGVTDADAADPGCVPTIHGRERRAGHDTGRWHGQRQRSGPARSTSSHRRVSQVRSPSTTQSATPAARDRPPPACRPPSRSPSPVRSSGSSMI